MRPSRDMEVAEVEAFLSMMAHFFLSGRFPQHWLAGMGTKQSMMTGWLLATPFFKFQTPDTDHSGVL